MKEKEKETDNLLQKEANPRLLFEAPKASSVDESQLCKVWGHWLVRAPGPGGAWGATGMGVGGASVGGSSPDAGLPAFIKQPCSNVFIFPANS